MKQVNNVKKWLSKGLKILEELTYFVPDLFFGLTVLSVFQDFGQYNFIVTLCLFMVYVASVLAERFYRKLMLSKEIIEGTIDQVDEIVSDFERQINDRKFITMSGLMKFAEIIEKDMNDKIDILKEELNKGDAVIEMDKEEQRQDR
ncbi:hypothetical protein [Brevibacillus laterosporus]|uniref:hypothetical protein n=1 Tax=Brevibacillus laterosporus TaxID=1465 RepID=UPI00215CA1AB|nr:hypothetical protein [Brevibacillus laterosporus]MCR8994564.1 hypothetical protein [Brevibacillus laterosporus]